MEHEWIEYYDEIDDSDEQSYYCQNCGVKSWIAMNMRYIYNRKNRWDLFTCEEFIIKNIIE